MRPHRFTLLTSLLITTFGLFSCRTDAPAAEVQRVEGETMGTYYRVSYLGEPMPDLKGDLDSLLAALNDEVSTYIPTSDISSFNKAQAGPWQPDGPLSYFWDNLELAFEVHETTDGAFDPTVMPLVNYWGFGYTPKKPVTAVDSVKIDSLMAFVGMNKLRYAPDSQLLNKPLAGIQLDFSACAKGYGVDLLGRFLAEQGLSSYFIDIGGEVLARGDKGEAGPWRVGINVPREEAAPDELQAAVPLTDAAVATSGNYRNFYEVEGRKYSHTINPFTGYPERSRLLSASILAPDCATADAYATAVMVLGLERGLALIEAQAELEAYLIYGDENGRLQTRATPGFQTLLDQQTSNE